MAKLIGSSLSLCLREIVRDKVSVDDIEFIIANTAYEDVAQMEAGLRRSMTPGPATDEMIERSEEHTSELQSLMRISYAVFCLKKNNEHKHYSQKNQTTAMNTTHVAYNT